MQIDFINKAARTWNRTVGLYSKSPDSREASENDERAPAPGGISIPVRARSRFRATFDRSAAAPKLQEPGRARLRGCPRGESRPALPRDFNYSRAAPPGRGARRCAQPPVPVYYSDLAGRAGRPRAAAGRQVDEKRRRGRRRPCPVAFLGSLRFLLRAGLYCPCFIIARLSLFPPPSPRLRSAGFT